MHGLVRELISWSTWRDRATVPLSLPFCSSRTEKWRRRTADEYGRGARAPPRRRAQPRPAQQASARGIGDTRQMAVRCKPLKFGDKCQHQHAFLVAVHDRTCSNMRLPRLSLRPPTSESARSPCFLVFLTRKPGRARPLALFFGFKTLRPQLHLRTKRCTCACLGYISRARKKRATLPPQPQDRRLSSRLPMEAVLLAERTAKSAVWTRRFLSLRGTLLGLTPCR